MRIALIATALILGGAAQALAAGPDRWPGLVTDVFDDRPMNDGAGVISLETPYRAEDAAIVPVTIRSELPADSTRKIVKVTLVIDNNPSPVAAEFEIGPERRIGEISTRVRVDAYTNVHAVAELDDGSLHAVANFVKASGGCAAPSAKNPGAQTEIGEMRLRGFDNPEAAGQGMTDAQLMIRHPNNSGLQRDLLTNYYIPAWFVRGIDVTVGEDLLFRMSGGISISENPTFRFTFEGTGDEPMAVEAVDTKDAVFEGAWPRPERGES